MAQYILPAFNLFCNIQTPDSSSTVPCNLAWGRRVSPAVASLTEDPSASFTITLLLPAGTDITSALQSGPGASSYVEVPFGTGRWYEVFYVDDIGKGFTNEHRAALISPSQISGPWPRPYP